MTPADLAAIDSAVASVADRLSPENRFDLRQDLAIELLSLAEAPNNATAWARKVAHNWANHFVRDATTRRALLEDAHKTKTTKAYRRDPVIWEPTWYAPHAEACEFAPFACAGARTMHVKATASTTRNVTEDALIALVDSGF